MTTQDLEPFKADYDQISEKWNKQRRGLPFYDQRQFDLFLGALNPNSSILDLGCGSGAVIAKQLSKAGHKVIGLDQSTKLLEIAKKQIPKGTFILGDVEDYKIEKPFDAIVLWDVLFHLPRKNHGPLLQKIYDGLKPNGHFILTSGGSDEDIPAFTDQMFGADFYYDSLTPIKLIGLCKDMGFQLLDFAQLNYPDGERDKGRIGLILKKPVT